MLILYGVFVQPCCKECVDGVNLINFDVYRFLPQKVACFSIAHGFLKCTFVAPGKILYSASIWKQFSSFYGEKICHS
jgi:hypothetical protein